MTDGGFEAVVRRTETGTTIVLEGTVNRAAKQGLEEAYEQASGNAGEILLDFTNVEYINSTGIAIIVGVLALARGADRDIGAIGLTEHYKEVFEITRLSDFMHIYEETTTT